MPIVVCLAVDQQTHRHQKLILTLLVNKCVFFLTKNDLFGILSIYNGINKSGIKYAKELFL